MKRPVGLAQVPRRLRAGGGSLTPTAPRGPVSGRRAPGAPRALVPQPVTRTSVTRVRWSGTRLSPRKSLFPLVMLAVLQGTQARETPWSPELCPWISAPICDACRERLLLWCLPNGSSVSLFLLRLLIKILLQERAFPSFSLMFIQLFVSGWINGFLFYSMGNDLLLSFYC